MPQLEEVPFIGDGFGIFMYEKGRPTKVTVKNVLTINIKKTPEAQEKKIEGEIILSIIPRKSIDYPLKPKWLDASWLSSIRQSKVC